MSLWLATLRVAGRSPRTIEGYQETLARFECFLGREALTATRPDCMCFVSSLQETLAPANVSHHYRGLRAFLGWAVREGLIDKNPAANLRLSVPETVQSTPTVEQVDAMLSAARQEALQPLAGRLGDVTDHLVQVHHREHDLAVADLVGHVVDEERPPALTAQSAVQNAVIGGNAVVGGGGGSGLQQLLAGDPQESLSARCDPSPQPFPLRTSSRLTRTPRSERLSRRT